MINLLFAHGVTLLASSNYHFQDSLERFRAEFDMASETVKPLPRTKEGQLQVEG